MSRGIAIDAITGAVIYDEREELAPTREEQEANRQAAFAREADPLFFKVQRGEADEQDWLDLVAEIRARYPYPE
jgi:hypothetical protein